MTHSNSYAEEVEMNQPGNYSKNVMELEQVLDISVSLFEDANFDSKESPYPYVTMMGLFASTIEHCKALLLMLKKKQFHATQPISRCILENYVDIKNIEIEVNYANYLWSEYYNREKELAKKKSKEKKYRKLRDEYYENYRPNEKFKCLEIVEKFKLASLKDEYKLVYSALSCNTHSGVFSLLNRVMESKKRNTLSGQCLFKNTPSDMEITIIPLVTYYLLDSCEIVARGHGDEPLAMIQFFKQKLMESS